MLSLDLEPLFSMRSATLAERVMKVRVAEKVVERKRKRNKIRRESSSIPRHSYSLAIKR